MSRRGNNEGTIYLRKDGRWTASAFVNGVRRSFYGLTREAVAGRLTDALSANRQGRPLPNEQLRVGKYLEQWLESKKPVLRASTHSSYSDIVRLHLTPELGKVVLARLTVDQVQAVLNKKSAAGLSPRRIEYIRAVLRAGLNDAIATDKVSRNVAKYANPPRQKRREMKTLDIEQTQKLLVSAQGERLGALYALALTTGLRQGELLALTWTDVEGGVLRVNKTLQRANGEYTIGEPKTERSRRTLPLPAVSVAMLKTHKARQAGERLRLGPHWQDINLIFTNEMGGYLSGDVVTHRFRAFLERAGLPRIRFHDLRHTTATLMLAKGIDARIIMEQLGHSTINLTLGTYAHVMPHKLQQAADVMDALAAGGS